MTSISSWVDRGGGGFLTKKNAHVLHPEVSFQLHEYSVLEWTL